MNNEESKSLFDGGMTAGEKPNDMDQVKQSPSLGNGSLIEAFAKATGVSQEIVQSEFSKLHEYHVSETKRLRQEIDVRLQVLKDSNRKSRERSIAITKLQEAIMWLGMDLKELGTPNPYPQSYNPNSQVIEPTADGLKL